MAGGLQALGDALVGAGHDGRGRLREAISLARLGPVTTAIRSRPTLATSSTTSLIRMVVPSSTPFISDTSTVSGASSAVQSARLARSVCEGMARTVKSASRAASAGSAVARRLRGSSTPGR